MGKCTLPVYTGEAAAIAETFKDGMENYQVNKWYKNRNGIAWKVNSKGYLHALRPTRVFLEDSETGERKLCCFALIDYLLLKNGKIRESGRMEFKTSNEVFSFLENLTGERF